ncbi:ribonuclease H-like domain-containing protein [Tanacetum coccineum]
MALKTAQITTTAKLPTLKQGEYNMWRLRIEQYFHVQDYALWDVIENENSFKPAAKTTTNVDVQRCHRHLFAAIQIRFGSNEATKKTQKTFLKQMYENFSAPSTESLDSIFNRLQKFIVEQEVKGTASSSSSSNSHNMAFMSSPSSTNEVNTAYRLVLGTGDYMAVDKKSTTNIGFMDCQTLSKNISEDTSNKVKESPDAPMVEKLVSDDKLEKKTIFPTVAKIEFVRPKQQEKLVRKPVNFDHVKANCNYHQRERVVSRNNYTRVNCNYSTKKAHSSAHKNMAPRAVSMKTGLRPLNTARPVNTAHPKTKVYSARPMSLDASRTHGPREHVPISQTLRNLIKDMLPLGEEPKEGKLGKGTLKTSKLDFEDVYFERKGVKKEFSIARTPQQNDVVERRNRTLIKAARTMLADSKLPTTFWVEEVNTASYVQNMVLVVKPHNKTPYELFRGDRPKWLFDIDVLTKSMNYVLVVADTNYNDSVGTKESVGIGHSSKETGSSQDYILMPQ